MAEFLNDRRPRDGSEEELDRDLLARAIARWGSPTPASDRDSTPTSGEQLSLAAYIDGRLNESEAASLERRLASDPRARELWMQAKDAAGAYEAPPSLLLRRVTAMAPETFVNPVTFLQRISTGLATARPIDGLAWATAAILFVMVCLGGFELGTQNYAAARDGAFLATQTTALPFGAPRMF